MPGCAGVCPGSAEQAHRPQPWSPVAGSCVGLREEDAEPATGIGPHLLTKKTSFCQQQTEAGGGVLVRVFGDDVLAAAKLANGGAAQPHGLRAGGDQSHLDATVPGVIDSTVLEGVGIEVGLQQSVDHPQDVEIESGGQSLAVIVGRFHYRQWLDQIRADQQLAALAAVLTDTPQQSQGLIAVEVADGDRKSTRLNSSHVRISYAVFCLKKKK